MSGYPWRNGLVYVVAEAVSLQRGTALVLLYLKF